MTVLRPLLMAEREQDAAFGEQMRRWVELGRQLERENPAEFRIALRQSEGAAAACLLERSQE